VGNNVGCVGFMGVTALLPTSLYDTETKVTHVNERRLLLVFERATEGSLFEYLGRSLPTMSFLQGWDTSIRFITDVANGLNSLHKHKIIHRSVSACLFKIDITDVLLAIFIPTTYS
jgi:serine/threonine protein kinase